MSNDSLSTTERHRPSTMTKKQIAVRFFTYGVMTIMTIIGVIVCIGWAMGYRFDFISGRLSQVALLQFNSFPAGASVDLNGVRLSSRTATRENVKTGKINVSMSLNGYRQWSKTIVADPGSVRWLDYVRLIPQTVRTESIKTYPNIDDILASPDKKWALAILDKTTGAMEMLDLSNPKKVNYDEIKIPEDVVSSYQENSEFSVIEWNSDSRYVLLAHNFDDKIEYLMYDRQDKKFRNFNKDFGIELSNPHFSGTGGNVIFALTGSDLRKIDYSNKSISAPIATDVTDYMLYSNSRIVFTALTKKDDKTSQTVSIYDDGKISKIRSYNNEDETRIALFRTNDTDYLAIARGETVTIIPDPLERRDSKVDAISSKIAYLSSPGGIDWMSVSDNGRFVLAGHNGKVVSYDIETDENYSFELSSKKKPIWLDNYHLLDNDHDSVTMIEFDGANKQHIVGGDLPAFLSTDDKYLFSIDRISGGVVLQRSYLTTEK